MIELGQIAYEAYCEQTGGKSPITMEQLPSWDQLQSQIQRAWNAAAEAVRSATTEEQE